MRPRRLSLERVIRMLLPLTALAGINVLQAGGFEVARQASRRRRLKKSDSSK